MVHHGKRLRNLVLLLCASIAALPSFGQNKLDQNCVVSILNRTASVQTDGTWLLSNIPANIGQVRARATCVENGVTTSGQSNLFTINPNSQNSIAPFLLGGTTPIPAALAVTASVTELTSAGATAQLTVTGTLPDGTTSNLSVASSGSSYSVGNAAIATVSQDGLVTAVSSGTAMVSVLNEGALGVIAIQVAFGGSSRNDGIPDSWLVQNGLNPNDPIVAMEDPDNDGLTNLQEFQHGTDPNKSDTDGDGVPDGLEVSNGTDPLNPTSFSYAQALKSVSLSPANFTLNFSALLGDASQQLTFTGTETDVNRTQIDLTSTGKSTNYTSSDLTICNFGSPDGNVFAGASGACTITATNGTFSATASGVVTTSSPTPLSFLAIPGFANNVAVNGGFAYVAAGSGGLQVVNVSDRTHPVIAGSLATKGNANRIRVIGDRAYLADGASGTNAINALEIIDISNPLAPVSLGSVGLSDTPYDVAVSGIFAYVAVGNSGVQSVDIKDEATPVALTAVAIPGGVAHGVSVSGSELVVAAGSVGVAIMDLTTPSTPMQVGSVSLPDASRKVSASGNIAYVADYTGSLQIVDFTNPSLPVVAASTQGTPDLTGFLLDVTSFSVLGRTFTLAADVKFVNGVPIVDVTTPTNPIPRAILDFRQFRDDNGTGIAVDSNYVYLTAEESGLGDENGTSGDTRLYIGEYLPLTDNLGVSPTVSITNPAQGAGVVEGQQITVQMNASDDVAVAAVSLLVNGVVTASETSSPYQFRFVVPVGVSSVTLGATAVDLGGNVGTATPVVINVTVDPKTTATGTVTDKQGNPLLGATVTCLGLSGTTGITGAFSVAGIPTVAGPVQCLATAVVAGVNLRGFSASVTPVPGGITNVGTIIAGQGSILLLADVNASSTTSLVNALLAAGNTVTMVAPEYSWDTTNPPLSGFNCVIHLDGATYTTPLPVQSQDALEQFVSTGGGFIGAQWDGYERSQNIQTGLPDLVLQLWSTGNDQDCGSCNVTYNVVPGQESHPVLAGVPASFTFFADGHSAATAVSFATNPSTTLMTIPLGGPGVLVRQFGSGRVVNFSWAANYLSQQTLFDPNVLKLYINAAAWACQ